MFQRSLSCLPPLSSPHWLFNWRRDETTGLDYHLLSNELRSKTTMQIQKIKTSRSYYCFSSFLALTGWLGEDNGDVSAKSILSSSSFFTIYEGEKLQDLDEKQLNELKEALSNPFLFLSL